MTSTTDAQEVKELQELFALRGSSLPVALYSKFEIFQENLAKAEAARQEKEDRARVLAANQAEQMERVRGLREKARERNGVAVEEDRQEKLNQGRAQRALEAEWQEQREQEWAEYIEKARILVLEAKSLDARLDASEAEAEAEKRMQGTMERMAIEEALKVRQEQKLKEKKALASKVRNDEKRNVARVQQQRARQKQRSADEVKMAQKLWAQDKQAQEEEYLAAARLQKQKAIQSAARTKELRKNMAATKIFDAKAERDITDRLVVEERQQTLARNKNKRAERYRQRFVSAEEAEAFEKSSIQHLYHYVGDPSKPEGEEGE